MYGEIMEDYVKVEVATFNQSLLRPGISLVYNVLLVESGSTGNH
jgi:hypothetical protein